MIYINQTSVLSAMPTKEVFAQVQSSAAPIREIKDRGETTPFANIAKTNLNVNLAYMVFARR